MRSVLLLLLAAVALGLCPGLDLPAQDLQRLDRLGGGRAAGGASLYRLDLMRGEGEQRRHSLRVLRNTLQRSFASGIGRNDDEADLLKGQLLQAMPHFGRFYEVGGFSFEGRYIRDFAEDPVRSRSVQRPSTRFGWADKHGVKSPRSGICSRGISFRYSDRFLPPSAGHEVFSWRVAPMGEGEDLLVLRSPAGPGVFATVGILLRDRLGLSDGINEEGLHVSLLHNEGTSEAAASRLRLRDGLSAPWLVRMLLETCGSTREAAARLKILRPHAPAPGLQLLLSDWRGAAVLAQIGGHGLSCTRVEAPAQGTASASTPVTLAGFRELLSSADGGANAEPGAPARSLTQALPASGYRALFDHARSAMEIQIHTGLHSGSWHRIVADDSAGQLEVGTRGGVLGQSDRPGRLTRSDPAGRWAIILQTRRDTD